MATPLRRFVQSPLRVVLILHGLCVLASWGLLAVGLVASKHGGGSWAVLETIGEAVRGVSSGEGGMTLFWVLVIPLGVLLALALLCGLVYGKWGLPGYLQGRSVLVVPLLAAAYFVVGWLGLTWIDTGTFTEALASAGSLVSGWPGLSLVLLYASMSTSAAGLGWAAALAVTAHKRRHGKWETIGYVERP